MEHPHPAIVEYRQTTREIDVLSEQQQIWALKNRLLHALARAHKLERRTRALEDELNRSSGEVVTRASGYLRETARLRNDLAQAKGQLAATKSTLESSEQKTRALEETCRGLLLTIERAVLVDVHTLADCEEPAAASGECP